MKPTISLKTVATVAVSFAAVAIIAFVYYTRDPSAAAAPKCFFRLVTGWECPGCGAQRALHAFLHGRVAEAWSFNPFLFFAVPAAILFIIVEALRNRHPRLHRAIINQTTIAATIAATTAWWLLRNL